MCKKNSENGVELPISTKYAVKKRHGDHRTGSTGFARSPALACGATSARANHGHAHWPVMRFWEMAPDQRVWDNSSELSARGVMDGSSISERRMLVGQ